ncbi:hypothetical protein NQ315_004337 [Exocentrus adspersus]|uniref:Uncharacterized protein n=1 Tax=Exocentrus adspersus TaxID=1586481 RepID=A0AAV8W7X2_9CUCU|nr:hypothetical protein NQ315_004337 [Exocentrus adspersus]
MASPHKKIKLTPKKEQPCSPSRGAIPKRSSQESKVTSTPQRRSHQSPSPDISRISSNSSSGARTRLTYSSDSDNGTDGNVPAFICRSISPSTPTMPGSPSCLSISSFSSTIDSESDGSTPDISIHTPRSEKSSQSGVLAIEDYDAYIDGFQKIKYKGTIWKMYQPLDSNSLYTRVVEAPKNAQEIVTELLLMYSKKRKDAVMMLIKFCVDVCGFQNFQVSDHYKFEDEGSSKRVVDIMSSKAVIGQHDILKRTGRYLLMESKGKLVPFLKAAIYNLLHKLILRAHDRAIKILTPLVLVYNKAVSIKEPIPTRLKMQKQEINRFLDRLYEGRTTLMRVECTHEATIWVRYFPKIFITQLETAKYLLKLVVDPAIKVRYAALETFEALVATPTVLVILKKATPGFSEYIGNRFYDVDVKVAKKAIDIYRALLKYDQSLISTNYFKMLMNLVFDKIFPIGESACQFLIDYLKKTEEYEDLVLVQLAKFSIRPGDATIQLLVEGCIDYFPGIRNWKLYIRIFNRAEVDMDTKEQLAQLFAEAVHQVLVGRSTVMREKSRMVPVVDPAEHKKVAKYLPEIPTLLDKYRHFPTILVEFIKILPLVNASSLNEIPFDVYKKLLLIMEKLFDYHNDESLLKKICEALNAFSTLTNHKDKVEAFIENITLRYSNDLASAFMQAGSHTGDIILKISILLINFDLTKKIEWETLFDHWSDFDSLTAVKLMYCCKLYLIWSLKNLAAAEKPLEHFPAHQRICAEFTSTCFNGLANSKEQQLLFKTYEHLGDFYVSYMTELGALKKSDKQLEQLELSIEDQLQRVLKSFLDEYVVSNSTMPLEERRSYVVRYIDMVHKRVMPTECLAYIYKYYFKYYKDYGLIIESSLMSVMAADEVVFIMVIVHTLITCYEHMLSKYNAADMTSQESWNLKLLINQFLRFKEMRFSRRCIMIMMFGINYAMKDESKYAFLYFLPYFATVLTNEKEKQEVLEFFRKKVPGSAVKNDAVLFFSQRIKEINSGEATQKENRLGVPKESKGAIKKSKPVVENPKRRARSKESGKKPKAAKEKVVAKKTTKSKKDVDSETDVSDDDMSIHDSESDDMEFSMQSLKI